MPQIVTGDYSPGSFIVATTECKREVREGVLPTIPEAVDTPSAGDEIHIRTSLSL
jgi:hypothetical protein